MSEDFKEGIDIVLNEELAPPAEVVVDTEAPAKDKDKAVDPDTGIDALRKRLEAEQAARIEAERHAQEQAARAYHAQTEAQETNLHLLNGSIESYKQRAEVLNSNYAHALETGDYTTAANIQRAMARNEAELLQLEQGRDQLQNAPKPQPQQYQPAPPSDPVEAFAANCSPESAKWVRAHPEYVTDPDLQQQMFAAHNYAIAKGHRADSRSYFETIEDILFGDDAPRQPTRRSAPPAAPVSRGSTVGQGSGNSTRVRLSAEQRDAARMSGMTDEEYAKSFLALKREGRIN